VWFHISGRAYILGSIFHQTDRGFFFPFRFLKNIIVRPVCTTTSWWNASSSPERRELIDQNPGCLKKSS
jgi:hypothetical protein